MPAFVADEAVASVTSGLELVVLLVSGCSVTQEIATKAAKSNDENMRKVDFIGFDLGLKVVQYSKKKEHPVKDALL